MTAQRVDRRGSWRCDWLPKGGHAPQTSWHGTEQAADVAAWRLKFSGHRFVLVWEDHATYEEIA